MNDGRDERLQIPVCLRGDGAAVLQQADPLDDRLPLIGLGQEVIRAQLRRPRRDAAGHKAGVYQHTGLARLLRADLLEQVQPVHPVEHQVHHQHVRARLAQQRDDPSALSGGAGDLNIRLSGQFRRQIVPKLLVRVGNQDSDHVHCFLSLHDINFSNAACISGP